MFTGEMVDANDLVYLRARYYVPELGVFTGLDPIENLNRYQYVGSNPTNRIDPSGLQDQDCWYGCFADPCSYTSDASYSSGGCLADSPARNGGFLNSKFFDCMKNCSDYYGEDRSTGAHILGNMLVPIANAIEHTSHYSRIALGWEDAPANMSRWEVAGETVFGLYDLFSLGAFSDVRYGVRDRDPVRVVFGIVGIVGFDLAVAGGHSRWLSFRGQGPVNACGIPLVADDIVGGRQTGTVYDQITPVGSNWPGHQIPQSFYLDSGGETFYVIRDATEHMPEYLTRPMKIPGSPGHAASGAMSTSSLQDQLLLSSFEASVEHAVQTGMYLNFDTVLWVDDWELIFRQGTGGPYDIVGHAKYKPGGRP